MLDKIKAFFKNSVVQTVTLIVWTAATVFLIFEGVTQDTMNGAIVVILAAIAAVAALIKYLGGIFK